MKTTCGMLLSTLLLLLCALLPGAARADDPKDCSDGCYIVVCNDQVCSMWRCDSAGCRYLSNWPREWSDPPLAAAGAGKAPRTPAAAVAYAKVCPPGRRCDLYEVTVDEALRIGRFDNATDLVREREALRGAARKAR